MFIKPAVGPVANDTGPQVVIKTMLSNKAKRDISY